MKNIFVIVFAVLFLSIILFAQDKNSTVSVSIGKYSGKATEVVYKNSGDKLSELFWHTKDVKLLNIDGLFDINEKFSFIASIKKNIGSGEVNMDDYDWMCGQAGYTCTINDWSHHSYSPNTDVENILMMKITTKAKLINEDYILNILFGIRDDTFKWIAYNNGARGVYTTEHSGNFRDDIWVSSDDSKGITYEQNFFGPYVGLEYIKKIQNTNLSAKFEVGSLIATSNDMHHNRSLEFDETYENTSKMIDIELLLSQKIDKNFSVNFKYIYFEYFLNRTGKTDYYENGQYIGSSPDNTGGLANWANIIEIGASYKF